MAPGNKNVTIRRFGQPREGVRLKGAPKRSRAATYRGPLATPIVRPRPGFLAGGSWIQHAEKELTELEFRKLHLLLQHFGIEAASSGAWQELALALARAHVPGFQLVERPGRQITRNELFHVYAFLCLESLRPTNARRWITEAARTLCIREPWRSARTTPEVLRTSYYRGKRSKWLRVVRDAMAFKPKETKDTLIDCVRNQKPP